MKLSFIGWVILLGLLYWMSRYKAGYNLIYYSLILILVLLLIGNYKTLNRVMIQE